VLPGVALHLVQRGVNRQPCFFAPRDYADYLRLLAVFAPDSGCSVHAYCLMTNHVHLLLTPHHSGACARLMKQVNQRYVQRLNKSAGRIGTLWQGRFHSSVVASERYALACYRYIELNPVRAGLVARAREYYWSSYRANAEGDTSTLVAPHVAYAALGNSADGRASAYRGLFDLRLPDAEIEEIRKATRGGYRIGEKRRPPGRQRRPDHEEAELPGLEAVNK
jgi:putative transposase